MFLFDRESHVPCKICIFHAILNIRIDKRLQDTDKYHIHRPSEAPESAWIRWVFVVASRFNRNRKRCRTPNILCPPRRWHLSKTFLRHCRDLPRYWIVEPVHDRVLTREHRITLRLPGPQPLAQHAGHSYSRALSFYSVRPNGVDLQVCLLIPLPTFDRSVLAQRRLLARPRKR